MINLHKFELKFICRIMEEKMFGLYVYIFINKFNYNTLWF